MGIGVLKFVVVVGVGIFIHYFMKVPSKHRNTNKITINSHLSTSFQLLQIN